MPRVSAGEGVREYHIDAADLDLLESIYGCIVRFDDRRQVMICRYCRAQRTVHRDDCPFHALGALIDRLQIQESQGSMTDAETQEC
jgi:hypothetical protein